MLQPHFKFKLWWQKKHEVEASIVFKCFDQQKSLNLLRFAKTRLPRFTGPHWLYWSGSMLAWFLWSFTHKISYAQKKSWCLPMCQHWLGPSLSCASATRNFSQPTWRSSRQSGPNCEASMPAKNRENLYILESNEWRPYTKIHELSKLTRRKKTLSLTMAIRHETASPFLETCHFHWNSDSFYSPGNYDLSALKVHIQHALPCPCYPLLFRRVKMSTFPPDLQISQRLSHLQKKVGTKIGAAQSWSVSRFIYIYILNLY